MAARGLTDGEIALARGVFGDAFPYRQVRFIEGAAGNPIAKAAFRNGNGAITLRRTVHFDAVYCLADFSAAKPAAQGLFVHELSHVWQYERLGTAWFLARYGLEFVRSGFSADRMYAYEQGETPFDHAMLEAQAQMAGDYAEASAKGETEMVGRIAINLSGSGLFGL